LLKKLWPDKEPILPIDNTLGRIKFFGKEYSLIKPVYFIALLENTPIACTHAYLTADDEVRIRGTFCEPDYRKTGIAGQLVNLAIAEFPKCKLAYTFPRFGVEGFYARLDFTIEPERWPSVYNGVSYAWKKINE
jgi:GNAT superfamily N-acetyltransferase